LEKSGFRSRTKRIVLRRKKKNVVEVQQSYEDRKSRGDVGWANQRQKRARRRGLRTTYRAERKNRDLKRKRDHSRRLRIEPSDGGVANDGRPLIPKEGGSKGFVAGGETPKGLGEKYYL